jgi:SAM-dependent methyltransferase
MSTVNPELDQDRAFDLYDTYRKYGYAMFPQQRRIYEQIAEKVSKKTVLEAGCGNGTGSAMLWLSSKGFCATDKLEINAQFALELYPWIEFDTWDISKPWKDEWRPQVVVAVEVIEHVADVANAIKNLIDAATEEVWISTPNGKGKPKPPSNPYHCAEFTVDEMISMFYEAAPSCGFKVYAWDDLTKLGPLDTDANPLVFHVRLR